MKKALVVFSGGLDSTTVLAKCCKEYGTNYVYTLSFYYAQRHLKELHAVAAIEEHYDIPEANRLQYDVANLFAHAKSNPLLSETKEMPVGSYESQGDAPATEVPFRNGIFLSIASSIAMEKGIDFVYCGIHQDDDRSAYADTSPAFFDGLRLAVAAGTHNKVTLRAPFINSSKGDIVTEGLELKAPFGLTWSCYEGGEKPCGKCGTCIQRAEAFKAAEAIDPLAESIIPPEEE